MVDPGMLAKFMQLMQSQGVGKGAGMGAGMGLMSSGGGGDWKQTAGSVGGGALGAGLGTLIMPGVGTAIGAKLGSDIGGSLMGGGDEDEVPDPWDVFKKSMRRQYPMVSQSADRLAGMSIREASRGAGAAGMNTSAVLQSIRDAATRQANQAKASARDQMLQQAFDITGARQQSQAFNTMMNTAGAAGGGGGMTGGLEQWMKLLEMMKMGGGGMGGQPEVAMRSPYLG